MSRANANPSPSPRPFRVGSRDPQKYITLIPTLYLSHAVIHIDARPRIVVDHEIVGNDADTV